MPEHFDKTARSAIMARVKGKNTTPELRLRRALFALGVRYRLHDASLPGKPDIVLRRHRCVIFVHGCFWHWHGCKRSRMPTTNFDYWQAKISRNQSRDRAQFEALVGLGWRVLIVWECALTPRLSKAAASATATWVRTDCEPPLACIEPLPSAQSAQPLPQLHELAITTENLTH